MLTTINIGKMKINL